MVQAFTTSRKASPQLATTPYHIHHGKSRKVTRAISREAIFANPEIETMGMLSFALRNGWRLKAVQHLRSYASISSYEPDRIRNIAIIAHGMILSIFDMS
jgi:hypothetical protein